MTDSADSQKPSCRPLKTTKELFEWQPTDTTCRCDVPLISRTEATPNTPKTVFCHDYKDGYLQDKWSEGCSGDQSDDNYVFYNWQYVDMFIYFSHHFISVPPMGWVAAAHRHGVPVLGTIITEHDDGKMQCIEMLSDKATYMKVVERLVDIAKYYNFDGWLINIENDIPIDLLKNLVDFVKLLRSRVAETLSDGHVMWYDSVTCDGKLAWQNCLNQLNQKLFNAADSIYLNYMWTEENLSQSSALASSLGRHGDVYVGVDVFGRGMRGGGGYNTAEALACVRKESLSAVLFAPAWVFEKNDHAQFTHNEYRFWDKLHDLCPQHGTTSLPFSSHFCRGIGQAFYYHGQVVSSEPWYNLALQSPQPSFTETQFRHHHMSPVTMTYHTEEAFLGGGCLRLASPITPDGQPTMFKLFAMDTPLTEPVFVSYTVKCNQVTEVYLEVQLEKDGVQRSVTLCENDPLQSCSHYGDRSDVLTSLDVEKLTDLLGPYAYWMCVVGQQQWVTRCFVMDTVSDWRVKCVSVGLHQKISVECPPYDASCGDMCSAYIGQIQMNPVSTFTDHPPCIKEAHFTRDPPPSGDTLPSVDTRPPTSGWLSWTTDQPHLIDFTNIYMYCGIDLDSLTLLGHSSTSTFRVSDLSDLVNDLIDPGVSPDISLLIQPVLYSGYVESISMCRSISLDEGLANGDSVPIIDST